MSYALACSARPPVPIPFVRMTSPFVANLVSTIIPVYNRAAMLEQAVASVLAQTWRPIEVIISDDGSNDDTLEVALRLCSEHPDTIRLVRNPNRGPGPAREAGRQLARGEFIQYLDSDDRLLPRKFEIQVEALRANSACGIAYGITRLIGADGELLKEPFKWTGRALDFLLPGLLVDRWWCTHTPLYRRTVTDAIGPWCDLRYSQDWEYDVRAAALETRLVHCAELVSEHRHHAGARQTGSGKWLVPADRVRFFRMLFQAAVTAGVAKSSPEMRHFSRWVFRHCRESALLGEVESAAELCELAAMASGGRVEIAGYHGLSKLLGWERLARWSERGRSLLPGGAGRRTERQSWMT